MCVCVCVFKLPYYYKFIFLFFIKNKFDKTNLYPIVSSIEAEQKEFIYFSIISFCMHKKLRVLIKTLEVYVYIEC